MVSMKIEHSLNKRRSFMEVSISSETRTLQLWLSRSDQQDRLVQEQMHRLAVDYIAMGYRVFCFRSGDRDLGHCTSDLLIHNRA